MKMPPRKEPKETVVYPASKRKPPPFKPQRPSKIPRISTTESERTNPKKTSKTAVVPRQRQGSTRDEEDEGSEDERRHSDKEANTKSDSSEDLAANALATRPSKVTKPPLAKRKPSRELSPMSVSSDNTSDPPPRRPSAAPDPPPGPSQSESIPSIPQPLLIRLLHERFTDSKTNIDKNAIQVLQKYFEVFIRETIARAAAQKRENAEQEGNMDGVDLAWLELEDLEKVAAGMMLDF